MRLGQILPMVGPEAGAEAIGEVCDEAEQVGLDSLWVVDHVALPTSARDPYPYLPSGVFPAGGQPWWHAPSVLAFAAARTRSVRIGTAILVLPYRNALLAAKMLATIDALSGGRLTVGVGAGWMRQEFDALAGPFERRGALLDEQLDVLRTIWSRDSASYRGQFHQFDDIATAPRPIQDAIPILIGGTSDAALRRVVRAGAGWIAIASTPEEVAQGRRRLQDLAAAAGDPGRRIPVYLQTAVMFTDGRSPAVPMADDRVLIAGTPDDVAAKLSEFADVGVDHVIVNAASIDSLFPSTTTALESVRLLATAVRPALERRAATAPMASSKGA